MRQTLVVVDGFYDDFAAVRRSALQADYEAERTGRYPGRNSRRSFMTEEALTKLRFIVGDALSWNQTDGTGHFRAACAGEPRQLDVHFDSAQLSAIVYLNTDEQCRGREGTSFWRHRRTGATEAPREPDARDRFMREVVAPDSLDPGKWELEMTVNMKSNRLVVFQSQLLHSASPDFGATLEEARLIQVFFLTRLRR